MRLIDADEMKKELKDMDVVLVNHNVEDWIDEQPTVDAEPVRHGKWVKTSEFMPIYGCSECKERNLFDNNCDNVLSDYCPKCGAKMDAGDGE